MKNGDYAAIARGIYLEGLAVDHAREVVWYSDVIGGGVHGVRFDGEPVTTLDPERMWTGGVMLNADGAVLSSGEHGIRWNHPDTGRSGWLLRELDGAPINGINEMWPDGVGGIFFGTIDMEKIIAGQDTRPCQLWRLTAAGEAIRLVDAIGFTNGLAFDAARRRFYCNDTFRRTWAFDVDDDLSLSQQRSFLEKEDVDGIALTENGEVWITGFRSDYLTRLTPAGEALAPIPAPPGSITQVRFGGVDARDYFITVVPADGGDTLKEGGQITRADSVLYRGRSDVPGLLIEPANFRLQ